MEKINPLITQKFLKAIKEQKHEMRIVQGIKIKTCPDVFPPQSQFSRSSKKLHNIFGDVKNKTVLDIGTGTGIQAIHVAKSGAKLVVATDISKKATGCAKENVALNRLEKKISVMESNLFAKVPKVKFDIIIANLPIVDYQTSSVVGLALYDPNLKFHKRLLRKAPEYLKRSGCLIFTHANLQTDKDFEIIEGIIKKTRFRVTRIIEKKDLGYIWKTYKLELK